MVALARGQQTTPSYANKGNTKCVITYSQLRGFPQYPFFIARSILSLCGRPPLQKSSDMLPGSEKAIEVSPINNRWDCNSWDSYEYLLLKLVGKSKKIVEAIYSIFEVEVWMTLFFLSREWKVYGNHDVQIMNEKSTLLMERPHRPRCMKCHSGLCYSCSRPPVGSSHSAQLSWSVSASKPVKIILIVFKILVEKVVNE